MKRARRVPVAWTLAVCLGAVVVPGAAGGDPWVEVRSPHVVVVSDAGQRVARRVAERFERFRSAVKIIWPWARVDPPILPLVLAPRDESALKVLLPEYWQVKDAARPGGVFVHDLAHPWVVLRADLTDPDPGRPNPYHIIQHEFVHLVIRLNFGGVPAWLNEGMAELLGATSVRGEAVAIGQPIEHHVHLLRNRELLPVQRLFLVDHASPEYREREKNTLFYAQSWALAHYLVLDPKVSRDTRYKAFVGKVVEGMEPAAALHAQGLDFPALDQGLEAYVRQIAYRGATFATSLEKAADFRVRDLPEADWLAASGAFLVHHGRPADGRPLLEQAERKRPDLGMVQEALGLALYREGRVDEARERLERATRLDPADPAAQLLAGQVWLSTPTPEARSAARAHLERAIELAPEHGAAHALLAETLLAQGEVKLALDHALSGAKLEPGSSRHRIALVHALAAAGQVDAAREQAQKALGLGEDRPGDEAIRALLRSLEPLAAPESPAERAGPAPAPAIVRLPEGRRVAWGVFSDPDGKSGLRERGRTVEIRVPAGAYDLSAELGKTNAPRVLRMAEGDFVAEVTVAQVPQPDPRPGLSIRAPFNGAGLLLWQDEQNYVRLELGVYVAGTGATVRFALFERRKEGKPVSGLSRAQTRLEAAPTHLRLERRGRTLLGFVRQGSGEWTPVGGFEADLPATLCVGVAAVNASQAPFTAEFEDFVVSPVS